MVARGDAMTSDDLREAFRSFTTTVALITTNGPRGPNIMAAEWTFNVSYRPFLIAVLIDPANVTHDEILAAKEFGVNLVTPDLVDAMGFAGHYSKADTDKLSSDLFPVYPASQIHAPMVEGCVLNAECRLVEHRTVGDHTLFVGEVVSARTDPTREPLVLHRGSHRLGPRIERRPRVIVSATPMIAAPGSPVLVQGELTGPDRAGKPVAARLLTQDGRDLGSAETTTDAAGGFRLSILVPAAAPGGEYTVLASSQGQDGRARLRVPA